MLLFAAQPEQNKVVERRRKAERIVGFLLIISGFLWIFLSQIKCSDYTALIEVRGATTDSDVVAKFDKPSRTQWGCSQNYMKPKGISGLVTLVLSSWNHDKQRSVIRNTWGRTANAFFLVSPPEHAEIAEDFCDLIIVPGEESYRRLTAKTMFGLRWVSRFADVGENVPERNSRRRPSSLDTIRPQFVLKVDDDTFINVLVLRKFLESISGNGSSISGMFGRLASDWKPHRDPKSKYFVSNAEFPREAFPDYLTGPAYLMTTDVVEALVQAHDQLQESSEFVFPLEDVYVTGILRESLNGSGKKDAIFDEGKLFHNEFVPVSRLCSILSVLSIHRIPAGKQLVLHERLQTAESKCAKISEEFKMS